jgi:hypothetical protein
MKKQLHFLLISLVLILNFFPIFTVTAQGTGISLHLEQVDVTGYPAITVHLSAWDASGLPLARLAPENFTLQEDGRALFHPSTLFYKEGGK